MKVPKALEQMATSGLELATAGFREKHLKLLSHRGVLVSEIREHFIRNRVPLNPTPQQTSCWRIFSILGITGMAGVRGILTSPT